MTQGPFGLNVGIQIKEERERERWKQRRTNLVRNVITSTCYDKQVCVFKRVREQLKE